MNTSVNFKEIGKKKIAPEDKTTKKNRFNQVTLK